MIVAWGIAPSENPLSKSHKEAHKMATETLAAPVEVTQPTKVAKATKVAKEARTTSRQEVEVPPKPTKAPAVELCAECKQPFGEKQPRTKDAEGRAIHIHHRAGGKSTAPTKAKSGRPCKMCIAAGMEPPSIDTYYTVGTRKGKEGERKQVMVNTYLCHNHITLTDWYSEPRFVGRAPELEPGRPPKNGKGKAKAKAEAQASK
jgi:hypothetical protein